MRHHFPAFNFFFCVRSFIARSLALFQEPKDSLYAVLAASRTTCVYVASFFLFLSSALSRRARDLLVAAMFYSCLRWLTRRVDGGSPSPFCFLLVCAYVGGIFLFSVAVHCSLPSAAVPPRTSARVHTPSPFIFCVSRKAAADDAKAV